MALTGALAEVQQDEEERAEALLRRAVWGPGDAGSGPAGAEWVTPDGMQEALAAFGLKEGDG